jgi:DNA-binding NtrC family response regulator
MKNVTILVVDDEPQIRRVLRVTLSSNGYEVIEAKNGEDAIATVIRERPDLIVFRRADYYGHRPKFGAGQDSRARFGRG